MRILPYRGEHLLNLVLQPAQEYAQEFITRNVAYGLEQGFACTFAKQGEPIACAGLVEIEPHRALVWTFIGAHAGKSMWFIHRHLRAYLDEVAYQRVEAAVDVGFTAGHRWMKLLGFELETPLLKNYRPNGGDCVGYVRIKR